MFKVNNKCNRTTTLVSHFEHVSHLVPSVNSEHVLAGWEVSKFRLKIFKFCCSAPASAIGVFCEFCQNFLEHLFCKISATAASGNVVELVCL